MKDRAFLRADEVARELGVSTAYAYKLIRKLNSKLQARGYLTINGRVSRQYFMEKLYGDAAKIGRGDCNDRL